MFAGASAMVLASQSSAGAAYHPFDMPHAFWEEQFGFVLAEALAAGLAIVTTTNGAIPEVVAGAPRRPGGARGLDGDRARARGRAAQPPAGRARRLQPEELTRRYSTAAAAERLAGAYDRAAGALGYGRWAARKVSSAG